MSITVQVNARVPEEGRPALLAAAARLRDDPGFLAKLQAFLAEGDAGSGWAERFAALEGRVSALEADSHQADKARRATSSLHEIPDGDRPGPAALVPTAGDEEADEPAPEAGDGASVAEGAPDAMAAWAARAAAITLSTGEGRGRKLTDAGAALFEEMVRAGVRNADIARTFGMARQSVDARAMRIAAIG